MVFKIFHCKFKIEFSFILLVAFALLGNADNLLLLLLFASLHECGHLLLLLLFKGKPDSLTLSFYGIGLRHSCLLERYKECIFLLGGIAVNGIFAVLNIHREINLPLLVINALPLYPLDMGRAIALFIPYKICRVISALFLTAMIISSIVMQNVSLILISLYIIVFSIKEDLR